MLGTVFERFVDKSPISVMVRATLERVLGADRLDLWYKRTAEKQYTRDLLFSTVYVTAVVKLLLYIFFFPLCFFKGCVIEGIFSLSSFQQCSFEQV
jgi:hypothetical protein